MMNGKTFDRLITTLEAHLKDLVKEDDDGHIDESEFHVICQRSKKFIDQKFRKHKNEIAVLGAVDGDRLSFRVVYHSQEHLTAYDRTIDFGVRSVFKEIAEPARKEIEKMINKRVEAALKK